MVGIYLLLYTGHNGKDNEMTIVLKTRNEKPYYTTFRDVIEVIEKNSEMIVFKVDGEKGFWELNKDEVERIVM